MKLIALLLLAFSLSYSSVVTDYLNTLASEAKRVSSDFKIFDKERGKNLFVSKHIGKKGKLVSCVSCHTNNFSQRGEHILTGKIIEPLSPRVNPERLSELRGLNVILKMSTEEREQHLKKVMY